MVISVSIKHIPVLLTGEWCNMYLQYVNS